MKKTIIPKTLILLFTLMTATLSTEPGSQAVGQEYIVQEGDSLSILAKKYYGDAADYSIIVEKTNAMASNDGRFAAITNPNVIEPSQVIWLPDTKSAKTTSVKVTPENRQATVVGIPETNCEIRVWYNYQVVAIPVINQRWIEAGISAEERAKRAYELRHNARINARYMMADKEQVKALRQRDQKKYGNPDGPAFSDLVANGQEKALDGDAIYQSIVDGSSRTSPVYNDECVKQ